MRIAVPVVGGALAVLALGAPEAGSGPATCSSLATGPANASSPLAEGRLPTVTDAEELVVVDDGGGRRGYTHAGSPQGLLRHVQRAPGLGTAYVNDLEGPDRVVIVTKDGVRELASTGEVSHPAWSPTGRVVWARDVAELELWTPSTGAVRAIPPPAGAIGIFSPVFLSSRVLVAVVQEPVTGAPTHDDALNNLWRHDLGLGVWDKLTGFRARGTEWSLIRTPLLAPGGELLFVRVAGDAETTDVEPRFELWKLQGDSATRMRELPGERYLAGAGDGGLLWNIDDGRQFRLYAEGSPEPVDLGCGEAMVDPRYQEDPDLLVEDEEDVDPEAEVEDESIGGDGVSTPTDTTESVDALLAIVIGDFATKEEATLAATHLGLAGLEVIDHRAAPAAVAPGVWAVASRLGPDESPTEALERFRSRFPHYADRAWVSSLVAAS